MKRHALIFASIFLLSQPTLAETVYISDDLFVPMRSGESTRHRIIKNAMKSGTALELLQSNEETGYSLVRHPDGTEGYVPSHYLQKEPIAEHRLARLEQQLSQIRKQAQSLREQRDGLSQEKAALEQRNQTLETKNQALSRELERIKKLSADTINIDAKNRELLQANQQLRDQLEILSAENTRLRDNSDNTFFMMGAGAVTLGIFFGLTLPLLRRRRNDGWV